MNPIVRVTWHDAYAESASWIDLDQIDDQPCSVVSVGFLLPDAKPNHVCLAQSMNTNEQIDSVLCIPVAMVVKTELL